jgi:hypothetical protein
MWGDLLRDAGAALCPSEPEDILAYRLLLMMPERERESSSSSSSGPSLPEYVVVDSLE